MHIPVLLDELIQLLDLSPGEKVIDATFGGGSYSKALSEQVGNSGKILGIDADRIVSENKAFESDFLANISIVYGNFRNITQLAEEKDFTKVQAVVFDLGLSSNELDDPDRGFSFQKEGPLDMRFDPGLSLTAADIVNQSPEVELTKIFKEFGEEKLASRIAKAIVRARQGKKIGTTKELRKIIEEALPGKVRRFAAKTNARIFQALRIVVNGELDALEEALPEAFKLLDNNGKLAVVSYHSLEDRIVKQYFAGLVKECVCPPDFPTCVCGKHAEALMLTKKPVSPSQEEVSTNSRARSAKLRAIQKRAS